MPCVLSHSACSPLLWSLFSSCFVHSGEKLFVSVTDTEREREEKKTPNNNKIGWKEEKKMAAEVAIFMQGEIFLCNRETIYVQYYKITLVQPWILRKRHTWSANKGFQLVRTLPSIFRQVWKKLLFSISERKREVGRATLDWQRLWMRSNWWSGFRPSGNKIKSREGEKNWGGNFRLFFLSLVGRGKKDAKWREKRVQLFFSYSPLFSPN